MPEETKERWFAYRHPPDSHWQWDVVSFKDGKKIVGQTQSAWTARCSTEEQVRARPEFARMVEYTDRPARGGVPLSGGRDVPPPPPKKEAVPALSEDERFCQWLTKRNHPENW